MAEPKPIGAEFLRPADCVTDRETYSGRSTRIKGFNRIDGAIGEILGITTIDPLILGETHFAEYSTHGISSPVIQNCAAEIWTKLDGDNHPLIVRRLFPGPTGEAEDGPRSGNLYSPNEVTAAIGTVFQYYIDRKLDQKGIAPEIMIHRVVDVGNPPLQENPFVPHPGGDVTPLGNNTYLIRATFGADESVQGHPCDTWTVELDSSGSVSMSSPVIEQKTDSLVPAPDKYRHIEIPADFQNRPALKDQEQLIISLAKIARNLEDQYGGHRLEFDETIIDGKKTFVIIEAVPFEVHNNSYEKLKPFGEKITLPLNIITSEAGIQALPSNELAIVHLPPEMFKGNELRPNLTNLAITAKAKGIPLVVLVAGNTATQHAVRNLIDDGHVVWFTEGEQFKPGEKIRLFKKPDGDYDWERENPIVMQGQMKGREVKRIGGKAKGMYELEKHGFPTPNRFVLETSVFRRIIEDLGLSDEFVKLDQLSATDTLEEIAMLTDSIQEKILNSSTDNIPDLEEALAQIGGDTFAVRSSAILEDGKVSLAGVYKTKLNVGKDGLRKAILQVLASAVSPLAVKSALGMDFKPSEASIAVIIQSMVQGPATGTVFTKDHLKRNDKLIRIEAARLGEQIVDDSATEDDAQKILIDKKTGRIKSNEFPVLGPILSDEQIDELVAQGLAIQSALGGPQDIEWAVDENGKIIFLQTRPL
jgi:hypothetical protein